MSPAGPERCGSTICNVIPVATAASKALPPRSRIDMPTAEASQCVELTAPKVPMISGRVVNAALIRRSPHRSGRSPRLVESTPPKAWRKIERVALCSASLREALASEIMIVLKLRIAASRAVHSQQTFVTVPTISAISIPRARSCVSNSRAGSANGVRRFFETRRSSARWSSSRHRACSGCPSAKARRKRSDVSPVMMKLKKVVQSFSAPGP